MKKAFTLVELLAAIIIIGVISLIVVPKVINLLSESKNKLYNNQISIIKNAANLYSSKYSYNIEFIDNKGYILLNDLVETGYIEVPIVNPKTGESFDLNDTAIEITKTGNKYEFAVIFN